MQEVEIGPARRSLQPTRNDESYNIKLNKRENLTLNSFYHKVKFFTTQLTMSYIKRHL